MHTLTDKTQHTAVSSHNAEQKPWYIPDPRIQTRMAARSAAQIADRATREAMDAEPQDEQVLFAAMHTCAFQMARLPGRSSAVSSQRNVWHRRWQIIRDRIAERNLGLVHMISRRMRLGALDQNDLLSEAMYALGRSIDRFDPWKGFRFSTYACNVITRALSRRCKSETRYRNLFPVQHDASHEKPSQPADAGRELSLERLRRVLDANLGELTDLEASVLSRRFPSTTEPRLTFQQIGRLIGLSKERARQIQNVALKKIRTVLECDPVLQ